MLAGSTYEVERNMMGDFAPVVAVIALFYAVGHWNNFFSALLYLRDPMLYPLQVFLRNISGMMTNQALMASMQDVGSRALFSYTLKYAVVMVGVIPVLLIYPFLQRYFVKGMMLGALKG